MHAVTELKLYEKVRIILIYTGYMLYSKREFPFSRPRDGLHTTAAAVLVQTKTSILINLFHLFFTFSKISIHKPCK